VKEKLGDTNALYPLVTAIVGSVVDGKPDFATVAHVGIAHLGHVPSSGVRRSSLPLA